MCQTLESISVFACVCVFTCATQDPIETAVLCSEMCVFVLTHAPSGHVGIRLGLYVCFSQPSQP